MKMVSLLIAFGAGILSFFSPCILPLIPAYLSFITGISADKLKGMGAPRKARGNPGRILPGTILFILGFSLVFISLGASASFLGNLIFANRRIIRLVGGIIIIIFGLHVAGVFNIKYLQYEKRFHLKSKPANWLGSFFVGVVFALGWTPCVGPILASILTLAATEETVGQGILLLSFYSLGLAVPFLLVSIFVGWILGIFAGVKRRLRVISLISGILLMGVGTWIIFGR